MITAIVILVLLAALGAFIASVSSNQAVGNAMSIQGTRAYYAARAGIEWGLFQVQASSNYNFSYGSLSAVGAVSPNLRACPANATNSFQPMAPTLSAFTVTVTCASTSDSNGGPTIYVLTSTACNQPVSGWTATTAACPNTATPNQLYVERQITVSF